MLGEKWTLLIVREALAGSTRFTEFQQSLGIAKNLLADRLETLVEFGVLDRQAYREDGSRERNEYVLTDPGRNLIYVIGALIGWGDVHRPTKLGPTRIIRDSDTADILHLAFVNSAGVEVPQSRVVAEVVR